MTGRLVVAVAKLIHHSTSTPPLPVAVSVASLPPLALNMSRPEHLAPPQDFYNAEEAQKYTGNSHIQKVQAEMTHRCIELLNLDPDEEEPAPKFILDVGAGSGLSGEILTEYGHQWVGIDISGGMLEVALEREVEGDLMLGDIGQGFGFRPGTFDGCISVSVLQWLCNADASGHSPPQRMSRFFNSLYGALTRGSRAVFQFYPESDDQIKLLMTQASRAGFGGGLVVDYPNSTKRKKTFLVLIAGNVPGMSHSNEQLPAALGEDDQVAMEGRRGKLSARQRKHKAKNAEWVLQKKQLYRKRGKHMPLDSRYTGRSRRRF